MLTLCRIFSTFFITLAIFALTACVRYTAPRSELDRKHKSSDKGAESLVLKPEEFEMHEKKRAERLASLVESRKSISSGSGETGYVLGVGDVLSLNVFGFPELSSESEILADRTVSFPMLGEGIQAAGLSLGELKSDLTKRLRRFVKNPNINLTVKNYQASRVFVTGEVTKPGSYALKRSGQQLLELISEAGGRTQNASGHIILVPASSSSSSDTAGVEISMDDLVGNANSRPIQISLVGGDTIIVPEAGNVEVFGEVEKPGSYKIASRTSTLGAIASAGGFTYAAKVDEVEIIRDIGEGKKAAVLLNLEDVALKGYKDIRIRDGDVIRVPSESGSFFRRQIVDVINGTFRGVGVSK